MAYAAVMSLKHTIERLKHSINNPQLTKSANAKLQSIGTMLQTLDDSIFVGVERSGIDQLDAKIRDAAWELEDVIESSVLLHSDRDMEQEIESFLKRTEELSEEFKAEVRNSEYRAEDYAAVSPIQHESTTVGLSALADKIINQLLLDSPGPKFVSLLGMAGIGKTHLATLIYHHPLIVQHFDSRAWVKLGQREPKLEDVVADIVSQIEHKPTDQLRKRNSLHGRSRKQNSLHGRSRRYLYVMDDVWNTDVYGYKNSLPGDKSGIQVLVTTRREGIATLHYPSKTYQMPFLSNEESWNLLWQNVFVDEKCFPSQLEKAGRKIAEMCEGLPLLILTVASILRGLDKTEKYWNMVAEKQTATFTDAYEQIYKVLLTSYECLPQGVRACFMYMGVFPQGYQIPLSKLINLWVVEDFVEPTPVCSPEDIATSCLGVIVSESLAIKCKPNFNRLPRVGSSKLHSTYWYLCVKEAKKNKLFHVLNKLVDVSSESQRRLAFQNNVLLGLKNVYDIFMAATTSSTTRSFLCTGEYHQYPVRICFDTMPLMRVLEALAIRFYEFPEEVLKLLQLRYLSLTHHGELPSSISDLQHLQCLILRQHHTIKFPTAPPTYFPDEIWNMQELRHLRITGSNLPNPEWNVEPLYISTLYVSPTSCTEAVFRNIPYLKKLGIKAELHPVDTESVTCLEHIQILKNLESLKCVIVNPQLRPQVLIASPDHLSNISRCRHLTKLSLSGLGYSWKYMPIIASLPNLKVLKLRCSAFRELEWETRARQFERLEYLLLEDIDVVHWTAQEAYDRNWITYKCFPMLCHLVVRHCYRLKKIPFEIRDVEKLEKIQVEDCSPSVVESAQHIKERSLSSDLELVIKSSWNL